MHLLTSKKSITPPHKKDGRINLHHFWNLFVIAFLLCLCAEVVLSVLFFTHTAKVLDAEIIPTFNSNINEIRTIEQSVGKVEKSVEERVGTEEGLQITQ